MNSAYNNLNIMNFYGVGDYNIPPIFKNEIKFDNFIGFNFAKTCKNPSENAIHFFLDDYQFERVWEMPSRYLNLLKKFQCVCSPDFSMYTDYPKAIQIFAHFKKHWLAAYWQRHGIKVIPTIGWSDKKSYEWCFDGEPKNATIAISSVGTQNNKKAKKLFLLGYEKMLEVLEPETIIFYGSIPQECRGNIVQIKAFHEKFIEARMAKC